MAVDHATAQVINHWLSTVVDRVALHGFPLSILVSTVIFLPPTAPHSLIILSVMLYGLNIGSVIK
jgi:uncharacterized membrane protein YdjX (TVP38/TMEM64 family)